MLKWRALTPFINRCYYNDMLQFVLMIVLLNFNDTFTAKDIKNVINTPMNHHNLDMIQALHSFITYLVHSFYWKDLRLHFVVELFLGIMHCLLHTDDTAIISNYQAFFKCTAMVKYFDKNELSLNLSKSYTYIMIYNDKCWYIP